jgi:hypothetical protein
MADRSIDVKDISWQADAEQESDSESDSDMSEKDGCEYMLYVKEKKVMVFESCLDDLVNLTRCKLCSAPVSSVSKVVGGANVVYRYNTCAMILSLCGLPTHISGLAAVRLRLVMCSCVHQRYTLV